MKQSVALVVVKMPFAPIYYKLYIEDIVYLNCFIDFVFTIYCNIKTVCFILKISNM